MKKLERMQNLIVVGHPDKESFCYNGIFKTIQKTLLESDYLNEIQVIDLYRDDFARPRTDLIERYKELVTWADRIYFVSPVWWFRLTPRTEIFFDEVLTPGFAYQFVNVTKLYAYPKSFLSDKKVRTYVTHGAPALPVKTLYLNSVKLRLVMGVYSFVFGWKLRICASCNGTGKYDSHHSPPCGACEGTGKERYPSEKASITQKK